MFQRYCEIVDGLPVFDPNKTPQPKEPVFVVPTFDGRGWNPKQVSDEKRLNKLSAKFVSAVQRADWGKVNELLRYGVDLDFKNEKGDTALLLAIKERHAPLVNFLLSQGADVNESNDFGSTALHMACFFDEEILVKKLLFIGANVHKITKFGANAMHYAAMCGNVKIAKKLFKRGIDFTCKAKHDGTLTMTPEQVADAGGHVEFQAFIIQKVAEQNDAIAKHMQELQKEAADEAKKAAANAAAIRQNAALKYGPFDKYKYTGGGTPVKYNPAEFEDPDDRHYRGLNQTSLDDFGYTFRGLDKATPSAPLLREPGKPAPSYWRDGPDSNEEAVPPLIRDYEYGEEPASFWDGSPDGIDGIDGPEDTDTEGEGEEAWTNDPIERQLLQKARKNRVRFLDVNGDEIYPSKFVMCENCGSENNIEEDYCSGCSFVLHGRCPSCKCIDVHDRTYCPNCLKCLFDDREAPQLQFVQDFPKFESINPVVPHKSEEIVGDAPVASVSKPSKSVTAVATVTDGTIVKDKAKLKFTNWMCNACGKTQLHIYNIYCSHCRYILADECPECEQKQVWGSNECGCCTISLWDGGVPSLEADLSGAKAQVKQVNRSKCVVCYREKCICDVEGQSKGKSHFGKRQDEVSMRHNTLDDELCPLCNMVVCICYQGLTKKKKTVDFVGKLKCPMCKILNIGSNTHCSDCGFSLMSNIEEEEDEDELYAPWGGRYYTPAVPQVVPRQNTVESFFQPQTCTICDAIDSTGICLFCQHCAHALGNRCPHCFFTPIDGKDDCPKCGKSQWNYSAN